MLYLGVICVMFQEWSIIEVATSGWNLTVFWLSFAEPVEHFVVRHSVVFLYLTPGRRE